MVLLGTACEREADVAALASGPAPSSSARASRMLGPVRAFRPHASLGKPAGKGTNLVELRRRCHAVALGHAADGNDALVFPVAIRA